MDYEFRDGRLHLHRHPDEKSPLLQRLRRIEGQVRGLQQMIDSDRYCLDEVQQSNAIVAGMRELAVLVISQHLTAGLEYAAKNDDGRNEVMDDLMAVVRAGLRQYG